MEDAPGFTGWHHGLDVLIQVGAGEKEKPSWRGV
jgi:hypothetical protein